jgi:hypothetical protein
LDLGHWQLKGPRATSQAEKFQSLLSWISVIGPLLPLLCVAKLIDVKSAIPEQDR